MFSSQMFSFGFREEKLGASMGSPGLSEFGTVEPRADDRDLVCSGGLVCNRSHPYATFVSAGYHHVHRAMGRATRSRRRNLNSGRMDTNPCTGSDCRHPLDGIPIFIMGFVPSCFSPGADYGSRHTRHRPATGRNPEVGRKASHSPGPWLLASGRFQSRCRRLPTRQCGGCWT